MRSACVGAMLLVVGLSAGCVTRHYTITSTPLGATVYRNGFQLGPTPADDDFVYYGKYRFTLIKDGYEPLEVLQDIPAPWYEWPGIDFISENLIPFKIRDRRTFHYNLVPVQPVRHDDVLHRAGDLRARGRAIGAPGTSAPVPPNPRGPVAPIGTVSPPPPPGPPASTAPPVLPGPAPVPQTLPPEAASVPPGPPSGASR